MFFTRDDETMYQERVIFKKRMLDAKKKKEKTVMQV